jgi:type II secretion system protein H
MTCPFRKSLLFDRQGFSLLELIMVLALLGIMAGVVAPATGRFLDRLSFRRQTSALVAGVRYARLMAVGKGRPVEMRFDTQAHLFSFSGAVEEKKDINLPEGAVVEFRPEVFVFYPDGLATPGRMVLQSGKRSQDFLIDPFTGIPVRQ